MPSAAVGGFLQGFMDKRTEMLSDEQERRDNVVNAVQKMQMQNLQKRQAEYDKQKQVWDQVDEQAKADPIAAYGTYAEAHGLKKRFEALGGKFEFKGGAEDARALLEQSRKSWSSQTRPEISAEELNNIQLRRAADDDSLAGPLRRLFGLSTTDAPATPWEGIKTGQFDLSTPAGQEAAAASIIAQKEKALAEAKAGTAEKEPEPAMVKASDFWKREVKPVASTSAAVKPKTTTQTRTAKDGSQEVVMITTLGGEVISEVPVFQKKGAKIVDSLNPDQRDVIKGVTSMAMANWERDEELADVAEYVQENPEIANGVIKTEVMRLMSQPGEQRMSPSKAATVATNRFAYVAAKTKIKSETLWGYGPSSSNVAWNNIVPMQTPEGKVVGVPWFSAPVYEAKKGYAFMASDTPIGKSE